MINAKEARCKVENIVDNEKNDLLIKFMNQVEEGIDNAIINKKYSIIFKLDSDDIINYKRDLLTDVFIEIKNNLENLGYNVVLEKEDREILMGQECYEVCGDYLGEYEEMWEDVYYYYRNMPKLIIEWKKDSTNQ